MKNRKVLLFIDSLGAGGAQRQFVGLATSLKRQGYDIKVVIYHKNLFYKGLLDSEGIPFEIIGNDSFKLSRISHFKKTIKQFAPDYVVSYLETPSIIACLCSLFGKKYKLIVSERNTNQGISSRDKIRFALFKKADVIVPNSYSQGDFIKKNYPNLAEKVNIISNFVDLKRFTPSSEYQRNSDIPRIVIAATIWAPKNTLAFIDAVNLLKKDGVRFKIDWYGKNPTYSAYYESCSQKIKDLGLEDSISLLDKVKNIEDIYREADYFCLPSFYEGTPNVICEAMASGLPVACSNVCDNGLYVKDGENGFLFNPKDPEDIKNKLKALIELDDKRYSEFRKKSREIAEEKLSFESFTAKYVSILS